MNNKILLLAGGLAISPFFLACDGGEVDDTAEETTDDTGEQTDDTGEAVAEQGSVRVMHLSPDAPAVDIFVDGIDDPVVTGLAFPDTTPYLALDVGTYTFRVSASGSSADDAVLVLEDVEITEDLKLTAAAINNLAEIEPLALVDNTGNLADTDLRITVIHAAPAVGPVDVWEASGEPTKLLDDVPFGANATLPDLPASALVVALDIDEDANPDVIFDVPALPGGTQVNVFATNDGDGPFLVAQPPEGEVITIDPRT